MLKKEEKDQASSVGWKSYSRSVSLIERPPRKSNTNPQCNNKARACLPPLQPLSIVRPSIDEWPRAGSDDIGVWPNPPTPGVRSASTTPRGNSILDQLPREFGCRKDKLAFFDKECSRILDHVYLGSNAIAKNREILRQTGITHVLNCVGFVCPEYFKNELVYKTLWLQDSPSEDITSILYDVFDYFEDVREQGGRVLVHCCQGVSRSTSLVIAYLMWKEGQSFDDAFQHVKAAREITNPNVGFACQLLQCQKRVHALPASPTSMLRMYRMAPHSPYDPLHLVPKMLSEPGTNMLDSRGAFIIHIPAALYVWIGKHCSPVMSDSARIAASQFIRYEMAKGPTIIIREGEETFEFWDSFSCEKGLVEACPVKSEEKRFSAGSGFDQRKLEEYDLDFEIFHRALAGGVVPPFPLSEAGSETCLPAKDNGWNRLRRKLGDGIVKEFFTCSKSNSGVTQRHDERETTDTCSELERPSSSGRSDFGDSLAPCVTSSLGCSENILKEAGFPAALSDTSLSQSRSCNLVGSFSSCYVSRPKSSSTSPSASPSTSDYSSSLTCSPSSSNWSDLSFVSAQASPCRLESKDTRSSSTERSLGCVDESTHLLDNSTSPRSGEAISACHVFRAARSSSTTGQTLPSLAECRSSSLPSRMNLPSVDEESRISENFPSFSHEVSLKINKEETISDAKCHEADGEVLSTSRHEKKA